jgi:hypothetical protein
MIKIVKEIVESYMFNTALANTCGRNGNRMTMFIKEPSSYAS